MALVGASLGVLLLAGVVMMSRGGEDEGQDVTTAPRTGGDDYDTGIAEKDAELDSAVDLEGELPEPDAAELLAPFADLGSSAQVAEVRAATVELLTADGALYRLPLDEGAIADRLDEPLKSIWSTAAQAAEYQAAYNGIRDALSDELYRWYSDNRFVVEQWEGVRVEGTTAFALLRGRDEYRLEEWEPDPNRQWQVYLVFEDGKWKLDKVHSITFES